MFVDLFTKTLPVPTDATATVTIRKLSWSELDEAQKVARNELIAMVGGLKGLRDYAAPAAAAPTAAPTAAADEADGFSACDVRTLLRFGIKAWSYSRPVTPDNVALIDEDCAAFFARQIYDLTKKGRTEADQKNG